MNENYWTFLRTFNVANEVSILGATDVTNLWYCIFNSRPHPRSYSDHTHLITTQVGVGAWSRPHPQPYNYYTGGCWCI